MQSNAAVLGDGQPGDKGPEGFLRARSCWGTVVRQAKKNPATRNRTRDHLIAAAFYSQMLYQLSYSRLAYRSLSAGCTQTATRVCQGGFDYSLELIASEQCVV